MMNVFCVSASEKQCNIGKAYLNTSIINADSNELHKDKEHNSPNERQKNCIWGIVTKQDKAQRGDVCALSNKIKCNQALTFQIWLSHGEKKKHLCPHYLGIHSKVSLTSG